MERKIYESGNCEIVFSSQESKELTDSINPNTEPRISEEIILNKVKDLLKKYSRYNKVSPEDEMSGPTKLITRHILKLPLFVLKEAETGDTRGINACLEDLCFSIVKEESNINILYSDSFHSGALLKRVNVSKFLNNVARTFIFIVDIEYDTKRLALWSSGRSYEYE